MDYPNEKSENNSERPQIGRPLLQFHRALVDIEQAVARVGALKLMSQENYYQLLLDLDYLSILYMFRVNQTADNLIAYRNLDPHKDAHRISHIRRTFETVHNTPPAAQAEAILYLMSSITYRTTWG